MRRFFVSPQDLNQQKINIIGDEHHHLKNVCRLSEGERIELLDGAGSIAIAEIEKIDKKQTIVNVISKAKLKPAQKPSLHIYLSLPRFQVMDVIVQKLVEMGVETLTPVLSERSFIKKPSKELDAKISRWNKIALQACKQSGRPWPLEFKKPQTLKAAIDESNPNESLFMYEGESAMDIKAALKQIQNPESMAIFIGSEGGFSPEELKLFELKGLKPVTMGDLVLRVETACIAVCSIIKYHFNMRG
ncbi:MAG: 16S rRNA (uracil(1498)-N(3))-methyltransferase [Oligoflexia bacterium]|nr:16S rRNA (uracil(1498)-N(3))-methyltransferase [Oligoflexia bacterium]